MGEGKLERQIDALQQRVADLQACAEGGDVQLTTELPQALAGLQAWLGELHAAVVGLVVRHEAVDGDRKRCLELFDMAPVGYMVTDPEGTILAANRAAVVLLDAPTESLLGTPLSSYVAEEDHRVYRDEVAQLGAGAEVRTWEMRLRSRGRWSYAVAVTVGPARDAEGDLAGLRWVFREVTEGKQAEEALQRSHDALEYRVREEAAHLARADAALQAEVDEHAHTRVNLAHRQAALEAVYRIATTARRSMEAISDQVVLNLSKLLKVPSAAIRRVERNELKMLSSFVDESFSHGGDAPLTCGPCAIVCRDKVPHQVAGALRERFSDSQCFRDHGFRSYIGVPVKDSTGTVTGILCAMDYEERVFGEDDVHLIEIFARYVANELERDVMEGRLVALQRFQVLGQLTSGVAHEIRNPVNAILVMAEALEARLGKGSEHSHYLGRIRTQVSRLSSLMQDLLDLGKPLRLSRFERVLLSAVCANAVELWRQSASESTQTVRLVQPGDIAGVQVRADLGRLEQVFINLIENAAQHSPENSEILLSILPPAGDTVRARVVDRGRGVPPGDLSRVFEPFFTTRKHGTGLGLSLVRHIVEAHQGTVDLWNNDPGPGCTVEVNLPLARET